MGFLNWLSDMFSDTASESSRPDTHEQVSNNDLSSNTGEINPATGLPMVGGKGGVDVEGNPYGTGFSHDDISTGMDDTFSSGFDDSFGSSISDDISTGMDDTFSSGFDDSFGGGGGFNDW